jgi:hypothetical protein
MVLNKSRAQTAGSYYGYGYGYGHRDAQSEQAA